MSQRASEKYSDSDSVPRTYLKMSGGHIRLDLTREQFEEFERRGVHMEPHNGGILIDCSRPAQRPSSQ